MMTTDQGSPAVIKNRYPVSNFKPAFDRALATKDIELANTIAMLAAENFFQSNPDKSKKTRQILWKNFFKPLFSGYRAQYQSCDFESVDYQLYRVIRGIPLARGPKPALTDLVEGRYVTIFGAAQLFGRYHPTPPHQFLEKKLKLACVNLAKAGAGPEFYTQDHFRIANAGRALVLQVFSGRSIGCEEYPGGRVTYKKGDAQNKIDRITLLTEIWPQSREEVTRLISKWQKNYLAMFDRIFSEIKVPILLAWISDRAPDDWSIAHVEEKADFGRFPHLVDRVMVNALSERCSSTIEIVEDFRLPHGFISRFTGEECPCFRPTGKVFWENDYYPSATASAEIGKKVATALDVMGIRLISS